MKQLKLSSMEKNPLEFVTPAASAYLIEEQSPRVIVFPSLNERILVQRDDLLARRLVTFPLILDPSILFILLLGVRSIT